MKNRVARLSELFLRPIEIIFEKVMTKIKLDVARIIFEIVDSGDESPAGRGSPAVIDVWPFCFRHKFFKNYPQDLK